MSIKDKIATAESEACFTDLYTEAEWAAIRDTAILKNKLAALIQKIACSNIKCNNLCDICKGVGIGIFNYDIEKFVDYLVENNVVIATGKSNDNNWISAEERLPEDDLPENTTRKQIRCFVYTDKGTVKPCVRKRYNKVTKDGLKISSWFWSKDLYAKPIYWMHYPEPPKEAEQ